MDTLPEGFSLYPYVPNKGLPIAFAVISTGLAALHFLQTFVRYKWPRFGTTMMLASGVWIAGFVTRAISVYNVRDIPVFVAQYILILLGPPLFAAAETFILGRLFAYLPYHAPMHPGRVLSTFFMLSVAVEALSSSGASLSASSRHDFDDRQTGLALLKAGLILQGVIEVCFFSLVALLHSRCRKTGHLTHNVQTMCYLLYITSTMMLVRCIVRAIEGFEAAGCDPSAPGYNGYCGAVDTHEWYLWVFEVANVTVLIASLAVFTPGKYLPRDDKQYLDPKDTTIERVGPGFGKADSRSFLVTVLDPFNVVGIVTGQGMSVDPFWERGQEHPVAPVIFANGNTGRQIPRVKLDELA